MEFSWDNKRIVNTPCDFISGTHFREGWNLKFDYYLLAHNFGLPSVGIINNN